MVLLSCNDLSQVGLTPLDPLVSQYAQLPSGCIWIPLVWFLKCIMTTPSELQLHLWSWGKLIKGYANNLLSQALSTPLCWLSSFWPVRERCLPFRCCHHVSSAWSVWISFCMCLNVLGASCINQFVLHKLRRTGIWEKGERREEATPGWRI